MLLDLVIARQAELVAKWLLVGFIHGVMNTDNMSIAGETIDYGPCAFMDAYDPATVYSSIDTVGRYAYGNQPRIAKWNLARLAETLLPLLAEDKDAAVQMATEALGAFSTRFETAYGAGLRRKLGLFHPQPDDLALAQDLLERMARNNADFTLTFRRLCDAAAGPDGDGAVRSLFTDATAFDDWAQRWRHRLAEDGGAAGQRRALMRAVNPAFIPRNHLVEEALAAAVNSGDLSPFESSADGAVQALRGSTDLRSLRRSATARSSRAPDLLRYLTEDASSAHVHASACARRSSFDCLPIPSPQVRRCFVGLSEKAQEQPVWVAQLAHRVIGEDKLTKTAVVGGLDRAQPPVAVTGRLGVGVDVERGACRSRHCRARSRNCLPRASRPLA